MKIAVATSAVLGLAGSSYGFIVNQFVIQPNATITPSSGRFVNTYASAWRTPAGLVSGDFSPWRWYETYIRHATFLAADRYGGRGVYYGDITNLAGAIHFNAPEWNTRTGFMMGDPGIGLVDPAPLIDGGPAGVAWGAGDIANFEAPSAVSQVNGVSVDSIFFAQFVLTDPNAVLVGADLLVTIDGADHFLPLDGSRGTGGYAIEYERDGSTLRGFVVVPTPSVMGLMGVAGLAAIRRHRVRSPIAVARGATPVATPGAHTPRMGQRHPSG